MKIFYFTGTGNSYYIAREIANKLNASLVRITKKNYNNIIIDEEEVGIVFPLYYSGIPKMVEQFILNNKFTKSDYIFAIENSGGFAGYSAKQINQLLKKQNKSLNYYNHIKMPANYARLYNSKDNKTNIVTIGKSLSKIKKIGEDLINHKNFIKKPSFISPILYKVLYKKWYNSLQNIDNYFIVDDNCNGCGICKKTCPANNIEINEKPNWLGRCEDCMACISACPNNLIFIKNKKKKKRYVNPIIRVGELFIKE